MTDRERWTVYPLLFLTLGVAIKDKLFSLSNVDTVQCRTLVVHDRKGQEQVVISSNPGGGLVRTLGTKTGVNVFMGHLDNVAGLLFLDSSGNLHGPSIAVQSAALRKPPQGQPPSRVNEPVDNASGRQPPDKPQPHDAEPTKKPSGKRN